MSKLDLVKISWEKEVEEQEIELIESGIPPGEAHEMAVNMISNRRKKKYVVKSGC